MTKKYIILIVSVLLSLTASAEKRLGYVTLQLTNLGITQKEVNAVAILDDETHIATLGNGYNACISQYEDYDLVIPGTCEVEGVNYSVEIGPMAFRFCHKVTEVLIGEGVTTIGAYAFVGCSELTKVTLPSTLTTIGSGAFSELASLKTVISYTQTAPTWEWNDVFAARGTKASMAGKAAGRTLYVMEGAITSYENTLFDGTATPAGEMVGWKDAFKCIYEFNSEPQTIDNLDELIAFRDAVNNGALYKNSNAYSVVLTADIDMSSVSNWTPIGKFEGEDIRIFNGTFNGGGHIISNLFSQQDELAGLFGITREATIYNFHLLNPEVVSTKNYAGTVCGAAINTRISDVLVTSTADNGSYTVEGLVLAGGIVGLVTQLDNSTTTAIEPTTIERCVFRGRIRGNTAAGGIVGTSAFNLTVTDCSADRHIEVDPQNDQATIGGIVGVAGKKTTIARCIARNDLGSAAAKGAIVGIIDNPESSISDCVYWKSSEGLSTIGFDYNVTIPQAGNKDYSQEEGLLDDATFYWLGTDWHYFTGNYKDYPLPATLVDMYMNNLVLETNADGLVFCPYGKLSNFSSYQVVGYKGAAETLTIPDSFKELPVISVADDVFNGNTTIKAITMGENMMMIGDRAFYGSAIETLTFGEGLGTIGKSAFEDCDGLQQVELPTNLHSLGARAFWGCDNLTSFGINYNFSEHDGNFLAYCHKLNHLYIQGDRERSANAFYCIDNVLIHHYSGTQTTYIIACTPGKTGNYTLPTQIDEVNNAFYRINVMGECFEGCSGLTGITFPAGKSYWVGSRAFSGATNLRYIDMSSVAVIREGETSTPVSYTVDRQNQDDPFYNTSNSTIIYLPAGHNAGDDEPNVVIGGTANRLLLTDGWDFYTPIDITATNGVGYDRELTAAWTEITQPTGNKIVVKDENGNEVEADEYEVIGHTYTPRGYSVCLPYELTLTAENAKVYVPSTVESGDDGNWNVIFTEVASREMAAYTPYYIVVSGEDEVDLNTTEEVTIVRTATADFWQSDDFQFKGTTATISNAALNQTDTPAYIQQSDGNWHKVGANVEDAYVPPYRGYFLAADANAADQLITLLDAIELADAADNRSLISTYNGRTVSVTIAGRTLFKDGEWNTLCLPFDVSVLADSPLEGTTVKTLESSDYDSQTGTLTLNFSENVTEIVAGRPYIVKWDTTGDPIENPTFTSVTVSDIASPISCGAVAFQGLYNPLTIDGEDKTTLYLGSGNTLYYPNAAMTIGAFRAYFKLNGIEAGSPSASAPVRAFVLNFENGNASGIAASVGGDFPAEDTPWYTIDGRQLSRKPTTKGLYINKGKKVVIKVGPIN